MILQCIWGFPDSSVGKESKCNVGDSGFISGLGKSTGEGIDYPLQSVFLGFPCGSADKESTLPMQETWVQSLGWEDPLEKETAAHSSSLA